MIVDNESDPNEVMRLQLERLVECAEIQAELTLRIAQAMEDIASVIRENLWHPVSSGLEER